VTAFGAPGTGIDIFDPASNEITTFGVPGTISRGDVSVFANGTLALSDQSNNKVEYWNQAGTLIQRFDVPGLNTPASSTVGSDGILYVAGFNSNNLGRLDSSGNFLGVINLGFKPGDLVMNPLDSTLWVSGFSDGIVRHITTGGTVLGSFSAGYSGGFSGVGLAPDGNSIYTIATNSTVVKHFDLNGNLLDSFALTSPNTPNVLTVVPAPEPGSAVLFLGGLVLVSGRRRQ
jgi:hypothetical protein